MFIDGQTFADVLYINLGGLEDPAAIHYDRLAFK